MGEKQWAKVGPEPRIGPVQFRDDGGFQIVGMGTVFDRSNELVNCRIGPHIRFDFRDGTARLENAAEVHHLRFCGKEGWEHAMVRKGGIGTVAAGCGWWLFALVGATLGVAWCLLR